MSRSPRRSIARLSAALVTGAVLSTSVISGGSSAQSTPPTTDLEGTVLRLGGAAVSGSTAIPAGRTLTPVRLTTSDPNTSATDGLSFGVFVRGFRVRGGARVPDVPAEQVTFRIDGTVVATTVPEMRFTQLQTDAGTLPAVVFAASGSTYAFPLGNVAATRTVAQSTVGNPASAFAPIANGLLPVGAQARTGMVFQQSNGTNFVPTGPGSLLRLTVLDADGLRRNADSPGEEIYLRGEPQARYTNQPFVESALVELTVTVSLRNGSTATVRALRFTGNSTYGIPGPSFWFLEQAPLAAAGATIEDVTGVISQQVGSHGATWDELGFNLA